MEDLAIIILSLFVLIWICVIIAIPFNVDSIASSLKGIHKELKRMNSK